MLIYRIGKIEEQEIECIVNSTNAELAWEETTVNGDILRKAGPELLHEFENRYKISGKLNPGDLFITDGYNCPARFICHVYSPWYGLKNYIEILEKLYDDIFITLAEKGIKKVALPLLGTGAFMIPKKESFDCLLTASIKNVQMEEIILVFKK
jgi:O-acetyl-ADP-ribose deacetylase (regulator of RNase III)